jgi:hypothetical protein
MSRWIYGIAMLNFDRLDKEFEAERVEVEKALNLWGSLGFELVNLVPQPSGRVLAVFKKMTND